MITFGSLFAGIGGFDLGFERAGMECRWQVEINKYANRVLQKRWPNVRRWPDVRTWPQTDTERVDVICGGFPCVNISSLGDRRGIVNCEDGSGLWREAIRIVRVLRPHLFIVENVSEILIRGAGDVFGDLAASGFDCAWRCLPAAMFGAAHRRDRFFAIGINRDSIRSYGCAIKAFSTWDVPDASGSCEEGWRESESRVDRVSDGVPNRVDRLRGLGNAVVPQVAEWIGKQIIESMKPEGVVSQ